MPLVRDRVTRGLRPGRRREMMVGMKSMLRRVTEGELAYQTLMFWCPGCERPGDDGQMFGGLHMLPVNSTLKSPSWEWDGDLQAPTLSPSILSRYDYFTGPDTAPRAVICHSYLRDGIFEFLGDCTHPLAGRKVSMPELPRWTMVFSEQRVTGVGVVGTFPRHVTRSNQHP